jgi:hypothetical protein
MEILKIIMGPRSACFLGQDFRVGAPLASPMDGGKVLKKKSGPMK